MRASDLHAATQAKLFPGVKFGKKGRTASQEANFEFQCRAHKIPVSAQFRFAQSAHASNARRRWIADFAFLEAKVMVEIDGGVWMAGGGAHSHPTDITRNMTKQNDATLLGFVTLRFTPAEVKSGHAIAFTQRILHTRGKP